MMFQLFAQTTEGVIFEASFAYISDAVRMFKNTSYNADIVLLDLQTGEILMERYFGEIVWDVLSL